MNLHDQLHYAPRVQILGDLDKRQDSYVPFDTQDVNVSICEHILSPIDLEDLFRKSPGARIVNNEDLITSSLSSDFTEAIYQRHDGNIGFTASCECGEVYGSIYEGMSCPTCNTVVSTAFVNKMAHTTWLSIPPNLPPVVHPVWYWLLKSWVPAKANGRSVSLIQLFLDPDKPVPPILQPVIKEQSLKYFYEHRDEIFNYLFYECKMLGAAKKMRDWIMLFYEKYKDIMFTTKLPILHSSLHPLSKNGSGLKKCDMTSKEVLEAVINLSILTFSARKGINTRKNINKTFNDIYLKMMAYYQMIIKNKIGVKKAIIRQHNLK